MDMITIIKDEKSKDMQLLWYWEIKNNAGYWVRLPFRHSMQYMKDKYSGRKYGKIEGDGCREG